MNVMQNKTVQTDASVDEFIASIANSRRHQDAAVLVDLFSKTTRFSPKMWGDSIIGYGQYHYRYATGREGDFLATELSPRKFNLSIYIMPSYGDFSNILQNLGKHKLGKSCLYVNKLADIDLDVLAQLITAGLERLDQIWPVRPS
ncbi:MAG: DUF1801 domain-containing protein [Rhodobacteraceae bacterium]|nr:DUF1801 domain-containing protein [Paracoccaceae bacterium]